MALLTVLMPTYKHAPFLRTSINSVLSQTFHDFELWVLVDGSPDNSAEIVSYYCDYDPRVKLLNNPTNMGRGYSRNRLINEAPTDLVAWMDSDDIMKSTRLEKQYQYMLEHPECRFLGTEMVDLRDDATTAPGYHSYLDYEKITSPDILDQYNPLANPTMMFYREDAIKLGGYKDGLKEVEDLEFWKRLYSSGQRAYCLPERLHIYRIGTHS